MNYSGLDARQSAKNYCFLLLKYRLRSEKELISRLERKKFERPVIEETLKFMKAKGFIDDRVFAREWVSSRIKKPLGVHRLKQELRIKGISAPVIDQELERLKESYSEEDTVLQLAVRQFQKLKNIENALAKKRVYGYLVRRGFSPEIVVNVINQLKKENE